MIFRRKKSEEEGRNLRRHYRRKPARKHALSAKLRAAPGSQALAAAVLDVSAGGTALALPAERDPGLAIDDRVTIIFTSLVHGGEIVADARVASAVDMGGAMRYGFQFHDQEALFRQLDSFYLKFFNRRRRVRVRPALGVPFRVALDAGQGELQADLHDLSEFGMGLSLDGGQVAELDEVGELDLTFGVPKAQLTLSWSADAVHLTPAAGRHLLGCEFQADDSRRRRRERDALDEYCAGREEEMARWETG